MSRLTLPRNRISNIDDSQSSALGLDASHYLELCRLINVDYYSPLSRENFQKEFYELMLNWKSETRFYSSLTDICMNESYQRIIGMGRNALPLIFNELNKAPNHWFWALSAITGENPIPQEYRGNIPQMTKVWLEWAKIHNFIL